MIKIFLAILFAGLLTSTTGSVNEHYRCTGNGESLQQLRIYELTRDNRDFFHQRFRQHAQRIMQRHGFSIIDIWESDTGDKLQFVYLLNWANKEAMEKSWKEFLADSEWVEIKRKTNEQNLQLVESVAQQPLTRLSYSPACHASK